MAKLLLNPGPTNTSFWTKLSQWFGSDVCHRTEQFSKDFNLLKKLLLEKYGDTSKSIAIMGGSGTIALESMISTLMTDDTLVVSAGTYGERALEIAVRYNLKCKFVKSKTIEDLKENKDVKFVYFVENETSTGEKYSIEKMSKIYPSAKFLIDATSSFGASEYSGYHEKIVAISFCSNKCLQSTPGLGIVIWDDTIETHDRSYYGDLTRYKDEKIPFTVPVQSVYALLEVSKKRKNNIKIFDSRRDMLINYFQFLGIECLNVNPSNSVISFRHPYMCYNKLQNFLEKRNIVIYSGVEGVENSFRVSTMSVRFDKEYYKIRKAFYDSCIHRYGSGHVPHWAFAID